MEPRTYHSNLGAAPDAALRASELVHSLMRYKLWADTDLIQAALALPALQTAAEGGYVAAIVRHFHTVDCIFRAHLLKIPHEFTSANPTDPATLRELQQRVSAIDEWYVDYTRNLDERSLGERLQVSFTDGEQQLLTRLDMLLHVSLHGTYHRGNVGVLLMKCGGAPRPDRFTSYLRQLGSA